MVIKLLVLVCAVLGAVAFWQNTHGGGSGEASLSARQITPLVTGYLQEKGLLSESGAVLMPQTTASGEEIVTKTTVAALVNKLLADNTAAYIRQYIDSNGDLRGPQGPAGPQGAKGEQGDQGIPGTAAFKGDKGDTGATGATGPQGPAGATGPQGAPGATGPAGPTGPAGADGAVTGIGTGSGLVLAGGVLSLKPCSTDEVLMFNGSAEWDCATVSGGSVDGNTTNTSTALSLTGTSLQVSITDSDGNTISSNSLELGGTFAGKSATDTALSSLADDITDLQDDITTITAALGTKADASTLSALSTTVTDLSSTVSTLATSADLSTLAGRVTTAEGDIDALQSAGYVTSSAVNSAITTALGDYTKTADLDSAYATDSQLSTAVSGLQDQINDLSGGSGVTGGDGISISGSAVNVKAGTGITIDGSNNVTVTDYANLAKLSDLTDFITNDDLDGYATESWVQDQNYLQSGDIDLSGYALTGTVDSALALKADASDLSALATIVDGKATQGDIDAATADMATETWVGDQDYVTGTDIADFITASALAPYLQTANLATAISELGTYSTTSATNTAITNALATALSGYTTTADLTTALAGKQATLTAGTDISLSGNAVSFTNASGYITSAALTGLQDATDVSDAITAALAGYATEAYADTAASDVASGKADQADLDTANAAIAAIQGDYLTSSDLSAYQLAADLDTDVALAGYIKLTDLTDYYTGSEADDAIAAAIGAAIDDMATETWVGGLGYQDASDVSTAISDALSSYTTANGIAGLATTVSGLSGDVTALQTALAQLQGYSATETATGKTYLGAAVYRKVVDDVYSGTSADPVLVESGVANLVDAGGSVTMEGAALQVGGSNGTDNSYVDLSGGALTLHITSGASETDAPYTVWVEYTKS